MLRHGVERGLLLMISIFSLAMMTGDLYPVYAHCCFEIMVEISTGLLAIEDCDSLKAEGRCFADSTQC